MRQRAVGHRNLFRRVARLERRLGDDHRHRLADMTHARRRKQIVGRVIAWAAVGAGERHEGVHQAGHGAEVIRLHIGAGKDGHHTRYGERLGAIYVFDIGMGMLGAQEIAVHLTEQVEVVLKDAGTQQQVVILFALDRLSHTKFGHLLPLLAIDHVNP